MLTRFIPANFAARLSCAAAITFIVSASTLGAFAHEGHQMKCSQESVNAMKADVQAMAEGGAKQAATKEMQAAQEMMRKKDTESCMQHMHKAMQIIEK